jgi:RNA polymerase sigma factor (sigma-70 family)
MTTTEYNHCVKEWADALFRFACKSIGSYDDAQDVVQQTFVTLWEKRSEVEIEKAKAFLFTIAYRRCMDIHRSRSKIQLAASISDDTMHYRTTNPDIKTILHKALARLDAQSRSLIILKDYEGYNYDEISKATGLNITQVKVYLHRARKSLKQFLVSRERIV